MRACLHNWNNLTERNFGNRQETIRQAANTSRRRLAEDDSLLLLHNNHYECNGRTTP